eukprot:NODE_447_length_830_cov_378.082504_g438_i0.p5 GENE.NODE_447_length_830_cov_378.082504_g438_i0~~NODE_447_length_830_cov_378.082504_g438_i0.p5  ORF type:complete len:54 (-),score=11.48 NODE_447_length_830_cov_378.082504_g438_i0:592-753(-)
MGRDYWILFESALLVDYIWSYLSHEGVTVNTNAYDHSTTKRGISILHHQYWSW